MTGNTHDNRPLFKMFNQVPHRYDLLNRLLTLRFDEGWRRKAARACLEDKHFNAVGIAFAFRNLTFHNPLREQCLAEVHRVLDEGGRFVIIESSQPKYKVLRQFWLFYIKVFVKPVGSWISGHRGAYNYLSHSIQHYYQAEEIKDMLISTGFTRVEFQTLMGGVAALHIAYK